MHYSTVTTLSNFLYPQWAAEMRILAKRERSSGTGKAFLGPGKSRGGPTILGILFLVERKHWPRRITRSTVITCARALAKVGENYGTSFARPWLSRGRRITNWLSGWLVRARIQDRDGRDSLYGCVKPSVRPPRWIKPPVFIPSRRTAVSPPPPVPSSVATLFLPSRKNNATNDGRRDGLLGRRR